MDLPLAKIATLLVLPLGLFFVATGAGLLLVLVGRPRAGGVLCGLGVLDLWLASTPAVSEALLARIERSHPPAAAEALPRAPAILLLGGGVSPAWSPRVAPDLGRAGDRVVHAARLYHASRAPLIILAGGAGAASEGLSEAHAMARLLRDWGVPGEALVLELDSTNTRENCLRARKILAKKGIDRVLLVTSALHMPRALGTCRAAGLDPIPAPTDFEVVDRPASALDWMPDAAALEGTQRALHELLGHAVYRYRGWIADEQDLS